MLDILDTDGDGTVSAKEWATYMQMQKSELGADRFEAPLVCPTQP